MTHLLWVAAPNGILPTGEALIRVLVVPHLEPGELSDYGLADWPATLRDTTVRVRTKTSAGSQSVFVGTPEQSAARSEVWHAFFDGAARIIRPPSRRAPAAPEVRDTHKTAGAVTDVHRRSTVELATPDVPGTESRLRDRITRWHEPGDAPGPAPSQAPPPAPSPDFHQAVALLREHPAVLRDLGLIFEVLVDAERLDAGDGDQDRYVAVLPDVPLSVDIISPWSKYDLSSRRFWPAAGAGSEVGIRHGVLDLSAAATVAPAAPDTAPPRWSIATFDIEGAEQSLREAAKSLVDDPGRPPALPGLRSAGLLLIRPEWQGVLDERVASASRRTLSDDDQHLTADELTLGYRVDIRRGDDSTWRSLCHRRAAYTVKEQDTENVLVIGDSPRVFEEGHVKPFSAIRRDDGTLHTDQVVLRWDGWSLVLPRLHPLEDRSHATRQLAAEMPYDFRWDYLQPGEQFGEPGVPDDRLPALRFSHRYQMRVRIADVTGGGPAPEDVEGSAQASQEIRYARHDPVRPPLLGGAGDVFTPGAAIDRLVLRSDWNMTAAQFAAAEPRYASTERRTLGRPTVSFEIAEQHGTFDAPDEEQTWQWAQLAIQADAQAALPDPVAEGLNAYVPDAPGGPNRPLSDFSSWNRWPDATPKILQLNDVTDDDEPVSLRWDANTLLVGLAKGERAVLELSSRIAAGQEDHFAWFHWLSHSEPQLTASIGGRNPAITPPRRIELVHAMRRPKDAPVWQLPDPRRAQHETTALLMPTFTGLDTDTTGRIEITATWREWTDSGDADAPKQLVHAQTVDPGSPPTPAIRHEFGDTKHRTIHYTIKAISRYRPYFFADEPDGAFEASQPQARPVIMLSTARPGPLVLRGTAPSFRWHTDASPTRIERVRSPRIRVEVARPWYQTGEGESLGVIVAAQSTPTAAIAGSLTEIGRDPVAASPVPARFPRAGSFTAATATAAQITPSELGHEVAVVPHAVTRGDDCWYADVAITAPAEQTSYMPFVKLALARYQPNSLPTLLLSPIVTTDLVPLLPERRLVVERRQATVQVTLSGPGPNPRNRFEAIVETCEADAPADFGELGLVVVDSEDDGIPAWRPAAGPPTTAEVGATAVVALPAAGGRARVRIREIEDLDAPDTLTGPLELTQRSVYFDVVELPSAWLAP